MLRLVARLLLLSGCSALNLGNMNPFKDFSAGGSTYRLAIAFQCPERGPNSIIGKLEALAADTDADSADGIAQLAGDAALDLLRQKNKWVACSGSATHYGEDEQALSAFDKAVIQEAAKFDREVEHNKASGKKPDLTEPTVAVVMAICTLMGDRTEGEPRTFHGDAKGVQEALQEIATASQGNDEVFAFELLWVPGDDEGSLDMDEVMLDWPELITV